MVRTIGAFGLAACAVLGLACGDGDSSTDTGSGGGNDGGMNAQDTGPNGNPDTGMNGAPDAGPLLCNAGFGAATACGGDISGTWRYQIACGTTPLRNSLQQVCGQATVTAEDVTSSMGTLSVTGTAFSLQVDGTYRLEATIPPACSAPVGGCAGAENAIETANPGSNASCPQAGTDCACTITGPYGTVTAGTVATDNGVATVTTNSGIERYHYCVNGGVLTYRQFEPEVGAVFVLTR